MSVFPGGLLKCAVTLELLATMLAQKEVLATAQTHEAQEGAGVCPSVGKGACTRLRTAPRARAKQTRSACVEAAAEDRGDGCLSARVLRRVIGLHAIAP